MAKRQKVEFIDIYLAPNEDYDDYKYYRNRGVLIRCKECAKRGKQDCAMRSIPALNNDSYCSFAVKKG